MVANVSPAADPRCRTARAPRIGRISAEHHRCSVEALDTLWSSLHVIDVDQALLAAWSNLGLVAIDVTRI